MTNEEAKNHLHCGMINCLNNVKKDQELRIKCVETLEKADKYRWHDLRENPNDLPEKFRDVLVCFKQLHLCDVAMYGNCGVWGTSTATYRAGEVIAWRYIEPFEE